MNAHLPPPDREPPDTARYRANDLRARVRMDLSLTLEQHGVAYTESCLDDLTDDAMFQIEHLLAEVTR